MLIVVDDEVVESNFHGVVRREMERAGVDMPLWGSHTQVLERVGPLGKAWRNSQLLELECAFG